MKIEDLNLHEYAQSIGGVIQVYKATNDFIIALQETELGVFTHLLDAEQYNAVNEIGDKWEYSTKENFIEILNKKKVRKDLSYYSSLSLEELKKEENLTGILLSKL